MNLISLIEKLRSKPDNHKRYISLVSSAFLTLVAFFIISAFTPSGKNDVFLAENETNRADGPIRTIVNLGAKTFQEVANQIGGIQNLAGSLFGSNQVDNFFNEE